MKTRIYVVKCTLDGHTSPRLVEAASVSQAIRHCTDQFFSAEAAGPKDIVEHMGKGLKVETVKVDTAPEVTA